MRRPVLSSAAVITAAAATLLVGGAALAQEAAEDVAERSVSISSIVMFFAFVAGTLGITYWAARRTKSAADFYAAGGGITGFQNGLAISGDYMSAASFLGISGLVFAAGFDGLVYSVGFLVGWPIILFIVAERLRNLGKYTFSDISSYRLSQTPIRSMAACGALTVVALYLIAQMVGAGKLIQLLFGLPYAWAVVIVGVLMTMYVTFGGMLATTWVQIIKAVLLLSGATFIAGAVLWKAGFNLEFLFSQAIEANERRAALAGTEAGNVMAPGGLVDNPIDAISLGLALMFGTAGLPHILMRFFTVADAKQARKSVFYATGFIGYFYILTFIIGFGAMWLLLEPGSPFIDATTGSIFGGNNMAAVHLSEAVGGDIFLGFISAVAFATILAVVAGLTLAGASAVSHDLYANVFRRGRTTETDEVRVSRIATVVLGVVAIGLGILFEEQNIAFMVGLAFAIAASANFPVLFLSMFWSKLTTRGAFIGGFIGLITALVLVVLGPTVWVDVLGFENPIFPSKYPALWSISAAFISIWFFSVTDKSETAKAEERAFEAQYIRAQTGIGAEGASAH